MTSFIERLKGEDKGPIFWEITGFSALLIVLNYIFFPNDIGFHTLAVSPFAVIVLLVVVRYGTLWGYYSAFIATLYTLFTPPLSFDNVAQRSPQLVVFLGMILILGPIHTRFKRQIEDLEARLETSLDKYKKLNEAYEMTKFLKEQHEKHILTQTSTVADLYQDARDMQILDIDKLYDKILQIVQTYVESEKSALYLLEGDELKRKAYKGYKSYDIPPPETIPASEEPYKTAIEKARFVSIDEKRLKETAVTNLPVYVTPLKNSNDDPIGVLMVDSISLFKFNRISRRLFTLIGEWASRSIQNANAFEITEKKRIVDSNLQIFRLHYFKMRLEEAYLQAKESEVPFTVSDVEIVDWDRVPEDKRESVLKFLARIFQENLREYDLLALGRAENELLILMSNSESEAAEKIFSRVEKRLRVFRLKPYKDESRELEIKHREISSEELSKYRTFDEALSQVW